MDFRQAYFCVVSNLFCKLDFCFIFNTRSVPWKDYTPIKDSISSCLFFSLFLCKPPQHQQLSFSSFVTGERWISRKCAFSCLVLIILKKCRFNLSFFFYSSFFFLKFILNQQTKGINSARQTRNTTTETGIAYSNFARHASTLAVTVAEVFLKRKWRKKK